MRRSPFAASLRLLPVAALGLALACAAAPEEAGNSMPSDEAERARDFDYDDRPAQAELELTSPASEDAAERSLDDIQLELAANEAKLRALGVAVPGRLDLADGLEQDEDEEEDGVAGEAEGGGAKSSGPSGGGVTRPSAQPPAPGVKPGSSTKSQSSRRDRKDKDNKRPKKKQQKNNKHKGDGFAEPPPDEAKAAPLGPNESKREEDAAGRCQQICVLAEVTCELSVQICVLAERHLDEEDYESACERASEDCEVAQEACDDCVG